MMSWLGSRGRGDGRLMAAGHVASYAIAHVPGDGVGPEVTEVARNCVDAVAARRGFSVDLAALRARREALPGHRRGAARRARWPSCARPTPCCSARSAARRCRPACSSAACCCGCGPSWTCTSTCGRPSCGRGWPTRWPRALGGLDFVIVRENTEGLYAGAGGTVHRGTEFETATEESLNTWAGVRRCIRYAAELAAGPHRAADPGPQDERAHPRRLPVAAGGHRGRGGAGRGAELRARRRGLPVPGGRPGRGSTSSSPTTCSGTSCPTWARRSPAAWAWPRAGT